MFIMYHQLYVYYLLNMFKIFLNIPLLLVEDALRSSLVLFSATSSNHGLHSSRCCLQIPKLKKIYIDIHQITYRQSNIVFYM